MSEGGSLTPRNLEVEVLAAAITEARGIRSISGGEGQLFVGADPGERAVLAFTPAKSGTFAFYGTIQGHLAHLPTMSPPGALWHVARGAAC